MQVTQTNADGLKREFKVVVPAAHIEQTVQNRLTEVGQTARIPGFRPGKIPMALLRKKYGASIMGEVLEAAVNDGAGKAITDNNLRPAVQPKIEITKFDEGSDLEFTMAIEVIPEITPMDFKKIKLERPVARADEGEIDKAIERIAERQTKTQVVEGKRKSKSGDIVVIDFLGKVDGVPFDGGKAEGYQLTLGSGTFIPGFEDQLTGAKAGDEVVVKVKFPEDYGAENLASKDAEFECKVNELREKVPTTVDDELAKTLGLDSLEALKTALREEMERDFGQFTRMHVKRQLLDVLADGHDFEVPAGMVDQEFEHIWKQLQADKQAGRLDESDKDKSDDELKGEYQTIAERRVRLGLLLAEVGQKAELKVTQDDINKALMAEARRYPGQEHLVFQYYQKNPQALEALKGPVFEDKVIDYIVELAQVTDKEVSAEELMKEPGEDAEAKPKKKAAPKKAKAEKADEPKAEGEEKPKAKKAAKAKSE